MATFNATPNFAAMAEFFQRQGDRDALLKDAIEILKRNEWAGDTVHYVCPECQQSQQHGHAKGCKLAELLNHPHVLQIIAKG